MSKTFFIADTHFGHARCIQFDQRPFETVEEMNAFMIKCWNERVGQNDIVYILGDFSWLNDKLTCEILKNLNGRKCLIKGNHDRTHGKMKQYFELIVDYKEIKVDDVDVVLSHYPIHFYNKHYYNAVHLYGHVHNSNEYKAVCAIADELNTKGFENKMFNVGCMMPYMNYAPRTLDEIMFSVVN